MTTTLASVQLIANGQPYIFSVDATDGSANTAMVNLVSSRGLGDTFASGATISHIGPCILNSSGATGSSSSILGAVITDPQNNVVAQVNWVDPETSPVGLLDPVSVPVGLNYVMSITTVN